MTTVSCDIHRTFQCSGRREHWTSLKPAVYSTSMLTTSTTGSSRVLRLLWLRWLVVRKKPNRWSVWYWMPFKINDPCLWVCKAPYFACPFSPVAKYYFLKFVPQISIYGMESLIAFLDWYSNQPPPFSACHLWVLSMGRAGARVSAKNDLFNVSGPRERAVLLKP